MNRKYTVKYSGYFFSDLEDVLDYISDKLENPSAAKGLYGKVKNEIEKISKLPMSYPDCTYWYFTEKKYRHCPIGNYSLFFEVDDSNKTVIILRFLYSGMNIKKNDLPQ